MILRLLIFLLATTSTMSLTALAKKAVKEGDRIAVKYIGSLKDGRIFDHNIDNKDLIFTVGDSNLIKPFETAFIGMKEGETKTINIPAKDAYGEFDETKVFKIPASELPEGTKEGDTLRYRIGGGFYPVRIIDIGEEEVYIDANDKLAGKDLIFEITLVDILKPEKK